MDYDDDGQVLNFVSGLVPGVEAGVALPAVPEKGIDTRRRLRKTASGLKSDASDRWDELADDVTKKVDEVVCGARQRFS